MGPFLAIILLNSFATDGFSATARIDISFIPTLNFKFYAKIYALCECLSLTLTYYKSCLNLLPCWFN